jgi:hypothetical protein
MNRFAVSQWGLGQRTFWVVVTATIVALLTWASTVFSQPYGDPFYEYGDGGMPRPDGIIVQRGAPPPGERIAARTYTYKATSRPDGSISITRNGVAWVTLANKNHQFLLSDPNGTGHVVVKMFGLPTRGGAVPLGASKVRAQVR